MTRPHWIFALGTASLLASGAIPNAFGQEPASTSSPQETTPSQPASPGPPNPAPAKKKRRSHADDFLLRGTVFTPQGLSFRGVELRLRRPSEKKFRWKTATNSRGEFAVRVPRGADYEIFVRVPGYIEQKRALDAKSGRQESVVFRMEPAKAGGNE